MKFLINILLRVLFLSLGFNYHDVNAVSVIDEGRRSSNDGVGMGRNLRGLQDEDPSCLSIVDAVCENPDWTVYCGYLRELSTLDSERQYLEDNVFTLFVPIDAAWELVDEAIAAGVTTKELDRIIDYHINEQSILSYDELVCRQSMTSKTGDKSRTKCDEDSGDGNIVKYQTGNGNRVLELPPKIISKDLIACNGIIHGIDHVMLPQALKEFTQLVNPESEDDAPTASDVEEEGGNDEGDAPTASEGEEGGNDEGDAPTASEGEEGGNDEGDAPTASEGEEGGNDEGDAPTASDAEDGIDGVDGVDGIDGIDGVDDVDGEDGEDDAPTASDAEEDGNEDDAPTASDVEEAGDEDDAPTASDDSNSTTPVVLEEDECPDDAPSGSDSITSELYDCAMDACIHSNCFGTGYYEDGYCGAAWYCDDYETYVMGEGEKEDNYCIRDGCSNDDGIEWDNEIQGWRCSSTPVAELLTCAMNACIHGDCFATGYYDDGYCGAAWYCDDYETYVMADGEVENNSCIRDGCNNDNRIKWNNEIQGWVCDNYPTCSMNACIHSNCFEAKYYEDGFCGAAWYCSDFETYVMGDDEELDGFCIRDGCTNCDGVAWNNDLQGWSCNN